MRAFLLLGLALGAPASGAAQCYMAAPGSSFDFVATGPALFETDFGGDAPGDFPNGLEFREGAMEVATWRGQRALRASAQSAFVIPLDRPLPRSFTVEIGVVNRNTKQVGAETIAIQGGRNPNAGQGSTRAEYGPIMWSVSGGGSNASAQFASDDADVCIGQETIVRLQVDGDRLRFYADERRLASIPNARFLRAPGLVVTLAGRDDGDNAVYVTRIRVAGDAAGAPLAGATSAPAAPAPSTAAGSAAAASTPTATPTTTTAVTTTAVTTTAPGSATTTASLATPEPTPVSSATLGGNTPTALEQADRHPEVAAVPAAPTGLMGKYVGRGRFAFIWNAVPAASEYQVWVKSNECSTGCRLSVPPLTDTTYTPPSTFDYSGPVSVWVTAVGASGDVSPGSTPLALMPTPRYKGVYRITVTGLRVNRETTDNPIEIDGKRDEVLVRAWANVYGSKRQLLESVAVESKVHGDRNAESWSNATSPSVRIKAGSASLLGGLRTGDVHAAQPGTLPNRITFPLLVWEGWLRQSEQQLLVVPTVWEVDRAPAWQPVPLPEPERQLLDAIGQYAAARFVPGIEQQVELTTAYLASLRAIYGAELSTMPDWAIRAGIRAQALRALALLPRERVPADSVDEALLAEATRIREELNDMGGPEALALSQVAPGVLEGLLRFYAAWAPALAALMNNADRPIGIYSRNGTQQFDAQMLRIDFETAERILAGAHGLPPGELQVRYVDQVAGANGDYTLLLRLERLE